MTDWKSDVFGGQKKVELPRKMPEKLDTEYIFWITSVESNMEMDGEYVVQVEATGSIGRYFVEVSHRFRPLRPLNDFEKRLAEAIRNNNFVLASEGEWLNRRYIQPEKKFY